MAWTTTFCMFDGSRKKETGIYEDYVFILRSGIIVVALSSGQH